MIKKALTISNFPHLSATTALGEPEAELSSGLGTVWLWTVDLSPREGRFPNHGYEATREAAMQAFAKA